MMGEVRQKYFFTIMAFYSTHFTHFKFSSNNLWLTGRYTISTNHKITPFKIYILFHVSGRAEKLLKIAEMHF